MHEDQAQQDAVTVFGDLLVNHDPGAVRGDPFTLDENEADRSGLNRARFDAAMWRLIDLGLLERDEDTENRLRNVKGLPEYDYGFAFRVTELGRELVQKIRERPE